MKDVQQNRFITSVKVGPKGQITIPKEAREMFDIKEGETLMVLGDKDKGIAILKEYRRKGYAGEALRLLAGYAFHTLRLHQLYAYVTCDNEASLALFESCGFTRKVALKQWFYNEGDYQDAYLLQCMGADYLLRLK